MSFASIWSFTSKMALVIIKKKNRISRPADNFQVKKGCIREACVLIPSVPEFCHTFFQHLLQLQLICQDHFLNFIQKSQYFSFNFIAIRFINNNSTTTTTTSSNNNNNHHNNNNHNNHTNQSWSLQDPLHLRPPPRPPWLGPWPAVARKHLNPGAGPGAAARGIAGGLRW